MQTVQKGFPEAEVFTIKKIETAFSVAVKDYNKRTTIFQENLSALSSFTQEKKDSVDINDLGKIIGDRVGAFRLGEDSKDYEQWLKKTNYLSLMHVPYLSLIKINFDKSIEKITLTIPGT